MNIDYLILICIGILGVLILMVIPRDLKETAFWLKLHIIVLYIMVLLGVIGLVLFVVDLL